MTKSARAKKAKKADFAKVKLKIGKLKKATNETRTDFKTRKIIIQEQLVWKRGKTFVTKKKCSIEELTSKLSHNNIQIRQSGVNRMLELARDHEVEILQPLLPAMIQGVAPCFFDSERLVRASAVKFMEVLIMKVGYTIEPYFNIVATHLSCAMVHLNTGVQEDSLNVMKILIKHLPSLIARHSSTLLKNFISLISRKTSSAQVSRKKPNLVDTPRMLHVDPTSTLTSHKWQLQLLQELSSYLEVLLKEEERVRSQVPYTTWQAIIAGSIPQVMCEDSLSNNLQEIQLFSDPENLKKFTLCIIPLLFQLWGEIKPESKYDSSDVSALSEEGVEMLHCIVSIITHLWHIILICMHQHPVRCKWFLAQLKSRYMSGIMSGFPYYCQLTPVQMKKKKKKKKKKCKPAENDVQIKADFSIKHVDDLNTSLAHFALQISATESLKENAVNFLSKLLRDGNRDGQYSISTVVKIILDLLPVVSESHAQYLVTAAQICYCRLHPLKKDRSVLLQILLVATDIDHPNLWECRGNSVWVNQVVQDLVNGDVQEPLLQAAIILRLRGNTRLKELVLTKKEEITEKIQSRGVLGMTSDQVNNKLQFLLKD